jgi:hypothetical protein
MTIDYKNISSPGKISFKDTLQRIWEQSETRKPGAYETAIKTSTPKVYRAPGVSDTADAVLTTSAVATGAVAGALPSPLARVVLPAIHGIVDAGYRISQAQAGDYSSIGAAAQAAAIDSAIAYAAAYGSRTLSKNGGADLAKARELATERATVKSMGQIVTDDLALSAPKLSTAQSELIQKGIANTKNAEIITPVAQTTVVNPRPFRSGSVTISSNQTLGTLNRNFYNSVGGVARQQLPQVTEPFTVPHWGFPVQGQGALTQKILDRGATPLLAATAAAGQFVLRSTAPSEDDNKRNINTNNKISPDLQELPGWSSRFLARYFSPTTTINGKRIMPASNNGIGQTMRSQSQEVRDQTPEEIEAVKEKKEKLEQPIR